MMSLLFARHCLSVSFAALLFIQLSITGVHADPTDEPPAETSLVASAEDNAAAAAQSLRIPATNKGRRRPDVAKRPPELVPLYVSFAALQLLDAHSTFPVFDGRASEANPVVRSYMRNRGTLLAVKAGATAGTIYLCERLWKKNRIAAVLLMVGLNSGFAAITAHNYRVATFR